MAGPYNDLLSKTELVEAAYLGGLVPPLNITIHTGLASGDKPAPCIICEASVAGDEDPPFSGNFWIQSVIRLRTIGAIDANQTDPKPTADTLCANLFDAFAQVGLAGTLNTAAAAAVPAIAWTCIGALYEGHDATELEDCWEYAFRMRLLCCASTLTP